MRRHQVGWPTTPSHLLGRDTGTSYWDELLKCIFPTYQQSSYKQSWRTANFTLLLLLRHANSINLICQLTLFNHTLNHYLFNTVYNSATTLILVIIRTSIIRGSISSEQWDNSQFSMASLLQTVHHFFIKHGSEQLMVYLATPHQLSVIELSQHMLVTWLLPPLSHWWHKMHHFIPCTSLLLDVVC